MRQKSAFAAAAVVAENGGCGEIVEVQGGHIVRSIGRKDRHSKVCTAKGPRDRRVRLSAPTAIQFYDVQDRLGFDRPSKAVDWLIKKAKSAIDDLAEVPPWNPVDALHLAATNAKTRRTKTLLSSPPLSKEDQSFPFIVGTHGASVSSRVSGETKRQHPSNGNESSFLPSSMVSDSIADSMKSFFPVGVGSCASTEASPQLNQQNYDQTPLDFPLRANTQDQDLRLSLQSFQNGHPFPHQAVPVLFSGQNNSLGFGSSTASWDQSQHNHQPPELGRIQRLVTWNNGGAADSAANRGVGGGFVFASPSSFQPVFSQSQLFSQRGPLQSINTPMIRAWFDPHHHQSITTDGLHHHHPYHTPPAIHQTAIPNIAFASSDEFSGFRIPARFQSEQEEHDDNKRSSASSDSRH